MTANTSSISNLSNYNREKELQEFDNTKLGVKGLVDSGITQLPRIFHHPPDTLFHLSTTDSSSEQDLTIPVIDLSSRPQSEIVQSIRDASAKFGFFQVINHGISVNLLDRLLDKIKAFHELPPEQKIPHYRRDTTTFSSGGVGFYSNFDLFQSDAASWRDTLEIRLEQFDPKALPDVCREEVIEWDKEVKNLACRLMGLLSEGLGLSADRLQQMSCIERRLMVGQYYPYCPEPTKTVGITAHTDLETLTILLQDQCGGLQVNYHGKWIDVKPVHGALVISIGDTLQMISNDEYKSGEHRVFANSLLEPRVSVAVFFDPGISDIEYGPLPELVSAERPVIDLSGKHEEVVKQLRDASAKFGFFQVINHGISVSLMDRLLDAVKAFHELQPDEKMQVYRRETVTAATGVGFYSNYDLFHSKAASWRDTLAIRLAPVPVNPSEIPDVCRTEVIEWDKEVKQLAEQLMGLLSEGLGLRADKLTGTSYLGRRALAGQYYPYCPEPKKTVGIASHTDPGILTVLLQDQVGGLQVKYDGNWINLKPVRGALVVNLGDLFQIISNDEYKSGEHRVYANPFLKPRVSIATFLSPGIYENLYGPLLELVSPVIDLSGKHEDLVQQLQDASAKFGFFQVINHGTSISLLDSLSDAVQAFHEMQPQEKMQVYRRDTITAGTGVGFYSNYDLFHSKAAGWQDTLAVCLAPIPVDPNEIPEVCRAEVIEWDKEVKQLGKKLMGLLCKGLGVGADKLTGKSYIGRRTMVGQYYPYCPEPDKTVGIASHTDPGILTVLLQDRVGGLQVKYNGNWINLKPFHGALVVNIGDLLQIISNDIYKSGEHREYANPFRTPRVSVAVTFSPGSNDNIYGPLPELVSPDKPALYQQVKFSDLVKFFFSKELEGKSTASYFQL